LYHFQKTIFKKHYFSLSIDIQTHLYKQTMKKNIKNSNDVSARYKNLQNKTKNHNKSSKYNIYLWEGGWACHFSQYQSSFFLLIFFFLRSLPLSFSSSSTSSLFSLSFQLHHKIRSSIWIFFQIFIRNAKTLKIFSVIWLSDCTVHAQKNLKT
jgi:hypothetical protein